MGRFDGKRIRGLVGDIVMRTSNGVDIIQSAPKDIKQTKATKQASDVFGQAAVLAGVIRRALSIIIRSNNDPGMVGRFQTPVHDVLKHCYDKETQSYTFAEDSFSRLEGFEFNLKSLFINSLWVQPQMTLAGNILKVSLPEINVQEQLKFPGRANVCELTVTVTLTVLDLALEKSSVSQTIEIPKDQNIVPAQDFTFEVPGGCLCVAGVGLNYFALAGQLKTEVNNKTFNPAAVCGAIITPGVFVHPPSRNTANKSYGSEWIMVDKLKLPVKSV